MKLEKKNCKKREQHILNGIIYWKKNKIKEIFFLAQLRAKAQNERPRYKNCKKREQDILNSIIERKIK
jgi:hypothetical protein